jgi:trans-aconitate methyltransferase
MSATNSQEAYFRSNGGDDYFERNRKGQESPRRGLLAYELIDALPPDALPSSGCATVLGGAGGREAAVLSERLPGWRLPNVDISKNAIDFGKSAFPNIEHHCLSITQVSPGLLAAIGAQNLIFAVGVLCWIDRQHLSRTIANIDESLQDGGYLLVTDFLPRTRRKNPIHHSPEHYTYKQDYSQPFLALGTYELVAMTTEVGPHPEELPIDQRRIAHHLLRKNLNESHQIG